MSLFINSKVHLPRSCEKCPFNYADMSVGICIAADKTIDTRTYGRKHHPDCPLSELSTPHGRLIDADKLRKRLDLAYCEKCEQHNCTVCGVNDCLVFIDTFPTIIEAEVSE